jgi:hypothetical protein
MKLCYRGIPYDYHHEYRLSYCKLSTEAVTERDCNIAMRSPVLQAAAVPPSVLVLKYRGVLYLHKSATANDY